MAAGPFLLFCRSNYNGQLLTRALSVDYAKGTVNGSPAVISETMIKWQTSEVDSMTKRSIREMHELDRLGGSYRSWGDGVIYAGPLPTYMCEKAPPQKF